MSPVPAPPPPTYLAGRPDFDPSLPLQGAILCCTSIAPDEREQIAKHVVELGGAHKYDLTPDITHLIVGRYDTPKYRHIARERPDIKAMDASWIAAVMEAWRTDAQVDYTQLEKEFQLQALETAGIPLANHGKPGARRECLLICLTGFDDPNERLRIQRQVVEHGGMYTGDLTRAVTHLIVNRPEGKKYAAAKGWNIETVSVLWLDHSIARGLILDEKCFSPHLPPREQGQGAYMPRQAVLGKRSRAGSTAEANTRKLRKTASMKLTGQRDTVWGDIMNKKQEVAQLARQQSDAFDDDVGPPSHAARTAVPAAGVTTGAHGSPAQSIRRSESTASLAPLLEPVNESTDVFSHCYFYMEGFSSKRQAILERTISSLDGFVCQSLAQVNQRKDPSRSSSSVAHPDRRFVLVPQTSPREAIDAILQQQKAQGWAAQLVTEFFVESCIHRKSYVDPTAHVLGRPFPRFPLPFFDRLSVCSAGFTGVELHHIDQAIRQLGARFDETFRRTTSLLVCKNLASIRKEKLRLALESKIPVVSADWLWACISQGRAESIVPFLFSELRQAAPREFLFLDSEGDDDSHVPPETNQDVDRTLRKTKSDIHAEAYQPTSDARTRSLARTLSRSRSITLPKTSPSEVQENTNPRKEASHDLYKDSFDPVPPPQPASSTDTPPLRSNRIATDGMEDIRNVPDIKAISTSFALPADATGDLEANPDDPPAEALTTTVKLGGKQDELVTGKENTTVEVTTEINPTTDPNGNHQNNKDTENFKSVDQHDKNNHNEGGVEGGNSKAETSGSRSPSREELKRKERVEISNKFRTLFGNGENGPTAVAGTTTAPSEESSHSGSSTPTTPTVPENAPASAGTTGNPEGNVTNPAELKPRRSRKLLGRAVSNSSLGSGSNPGKGSLTPIGNLEPGSTLSMWDADRKLSRTSSSTSLSLHTNLGDFCESSETVGGGSKSADASRGYPSEEGNGESLPPATQVEYHDKEAARFKAAILSKILNEPTGQAGSTVSPTASAPTEVLHTIDPNRIDSHGTTEPRPANGEAYHTNDPANTNNNCNGNGNGNGHVNENGKARVDELRDEAPASRRSAELLDRVVASIEQEQKKSSRVRDTRGQRVLRQR